MQDAKGGSNRRDGGSSRRRWWKVTVKKEVEGQKEKAMEDAVEDGSSGRWQ